MGEGCAWCLEAHRAVLSPLSCRTVCAFYAHGALPSAAQGASSSSSSISTLAASVGRHVRSRASFAVQLYAALHLPSFRALEPWLYRTSLRTLELLVPRFWREDRLELMERMLRLVHAQSASVGRVEAALTGWRTHALVGEMSDAQLQEIMDTFQQRMEVGVEQRTHKRQQRQKQQALEALAQSGDVLVALQSGQDGSYDFMSTSTAATVDFNTPRLTTPVLDLFSLFSNTHGVALQSAASSVAPSLTGGHASATLSTSASAVLPHLADAAHGARERQDTRSPDSEAAASVLTEQTSKRDAATLVALAAGAVTTQMVLVVASAVSY